MSASAAAQSHQLRCHHCQRWVGESREPMEFVGLFKNPKDRHHVPEPRDTRHCKACGWVTVFQPVDARPAAWRNIELKQRAD